MPLKIAKRGIIPPFIVMDVMRSANERAARGDDVLHLEVGQPGTPAPAPVIAAAKAALDSERLGYTDSFGLPDLRCRIADYYRDYYGVSVDPKRIVVTTGSSGGFVLSFLSAFEAGDRVALAVPGYPAYRNILHALDIETVSIPAGPETNFQPTPELIAETAERSNGLPDGLIVASPSNPTGTMIHDPELEKLTDFCRAEGIRLISDEIYHGITYEHKAQTALAYTDDAIVINSFSKYFSMTGWRLGWMVVPEDMLRSIECLSQNFFISPPTLSQIAAAAVFDCRPELDTIVQKYAENRALLLRELPKAGFDKFASAEGAFYLYADVGTMTNDSPDFCKRMLADTGVAVTPGTDFDPERGNRYIRFSFAGPLTDMRSAAEKLITWRR
ncbi:MAG: aminotransferase class I/II-fold pyridoxal phosphate-dependent enzyme [Rhodospirillales bacterium]